MREKTDRQTEKPPVPEKAEFHARVKEFFEDVKVEAREETKRASNVSKLIHTVLWAVALLGLVIRKIEINRNEFTGLITIKLIKRRIFPLIILIIGLPLTNISSHNWPLLGAPIVIIFMDITLIFYRQRRGLYGNNDLEFREAVRYVINENRSGRGPGDFKRVFPILERRMEDEPDALPVRP